MPLDCSFKCLRLSKAKSGVGFDVLIKKNHETEAYWVASISFVVEGRLNCAKRKSCQALVFFTVLFLLFLVSFYSLFGCLFIRIGQRKIDLIFSQKLIYILE